MIQNILLIDNLDSFSFNLVEAVERLGARVRVVRNTIGAAAAFEDAARNDALILLSPGPGRPEDAGCCLELIARARGRVPLLGVCLGHQAIVLEAGGDVCSAPEPVHGKASLLPHDGAGPFEGMEGPIRIGRYHSLCTRNLPGRFTVHAEIEGMAMAISDPEAMQTGLQFHPESILTPAGNRLLANIMRQAERGRAIAA
jgi:anthranilate synthase/aminodeoxychorismate synthase-like glutamine amidotransferase